ncbi:MAG: type I-E CRISPR-associated endoribonuclease Cas2e [Christensenellaceae bacterium]|jgi:CRISPR-associated protein Cas2|nr:type I-E CRISPR-associated endoribonuclease Cas2e [Christensenellaceae bacterium]
MVVLTLTDCPPALRGDLTKWFFEINAGVYVGRVNARVRDKLWERVKQAAPRGRATMVFNANNEQGLDFRTHNSDWLPIDFDGLKLIMRPNFSHMKRGEVRFGQSNASQYQRARVQSAKGLRQQSEAGAKSVYVVIDLETTGLLPNRDEIIEIAAIRVVDGVIQSQFEALLASSVRISRQIEELTGLTPAMLAEKGQKPEDVLPRFLVFLGKDCLVGHNIRFDLTFLNAAFRKCGLVPLANKQVDTYALARQKLYNLPGHKLGDLAAHYGISVVERHRGAADCMLTKEIYEHLLNET